MAIGKLGRRGGFGSLDVLGGASTPPALWTPAQLGAAVVAWWDITDAPTVTQSVGKITAVSDKSGHGFNLSSTGTSPDYSATAVNGHPGAVFSTPTGAQGLITATSLTLAQPFTVATMFTTAAGAPSNPGNTFPAVWDGDVSAAANTSNQATFFERHGSVSNHSLLYAGSVFDLGVVLPFSTPELAVSLANGASSSHWFNGGAPVTGDMGTPGITNGFRLAGNFFAGFGDRSFAGSIGFAIIINRALTTGERQSLEGYINSRFS